MFNKWCLSQINPTFWGLRILYVVGLVVSFPSLAKYTELFSEHNISVPFKVNQGVVAADILAHLGIELLVIGVDEQQQRKLAIYGVNINEYEVLDLIDIPNNFWGYDLGDKNAEGMRQLYFLTQSKVLRYVPAHHSQPAKMQVEQDVESMYLSAQSDSFMQIDFVQDLNNDGEDDIFLPHFQQVNLWLTDGSDIKQRQSLPIGARLQLKHSQFRFFDADLYFEDMNQDTKTDIVYLSQDKVATHLQNDKGLFSTEPVYIDILPMVSAHEWWDITDVNGQELDQSNLTHRKLDGLRDINGDGIADLVVKYTQSSGVLDKTIDYEFYYGSLKDGVLEYEHDISSKVSSKDTLTDLQFVDLENDGRLEVLVSSFDIGISQIVGALMSGSIDQDSMIFAMDDKDEFAKEPLLNQEVEMTFSLSSGSRGEPMIKMIDLNKDGVKDMVYSDGDALIRALLATPGEKRPYSRWSLKQKISMPKNPANALTQDLNEDGKTDLVLHYGPADKSELLQRLVILIAM
ncbi:VCBS repeat-containing protein [Paraglaciecola aquimarina]|uniref:VCBS repeat-containing protein n=1 Tax=Paraglaciecola aquimarina TaxID=1235557 RepID=A0ABU3SWC2_9ALTE|nr:VCBS repeat-containing protein [Paraglaciecola aquimarina]MDU0354278.1 VCBS repeat-containing protein [Paraglaciecola aquimarina]